MTITALTPLDRLSATFKADVDTFFATSLPTFVTEANALETNVNAKEASAVVAAADTAADAIATAADVVTATAKAAEAADYAASALTSPGTSATSTTNLTIGTGAQSLTIQTGKAYSVGQFVIIANTVSPINYMAGQITSYDSGTGTMGVNVGTIGGSGSYSAWTVSIGVAQTTGVSASKLFYFANK